LNVNVQQLQDQNTLLKAQRNNNVIIDEGEPSTPPAESSTDKLVKELEALRLDNERLRGQLEQQQQQVANPFVGIPPTVSQIHADALRHSCQLRLFACSLIQNIFSDACRTEVESLSNLLQPNRLP
jgi:hypothetical protein